MDDSWSEVDSVRSADEHSSCGSWALVDDPAVDWTEVNSIASVRTLVSGLSDSASRCASPASDTSEWPGGRSGPAARADCGDGDGLTSDDDEGDGDDDGDDDDRGEDVGSICTARGWPRVSPDVRRGATFVTASARA